MGIALIADLISAALLIAASWMVWREKTRFDSLKPLIPAMICLFIGRITDLGAEHPGLLPFGLSGLSPNSVEEILSATDDVLEATGIVFLIYGFMTIIARQRSEAKRMHNLESLLPVCANCKKYRNDENQWMPIEDFLMTGGALKVTHGICPECTVKFFGNIKVPNS